MQNRPKTSLKQNQASVELTSRNLTVMKDILQGTFARNPNQKNPNPGTRPLHEGFSGGNLPKTNKIQRTNHQHLPTQLPSSANLNLSYVSCKQSSCFGTCAGCHSQICQSHSHLSRNIHMASCWLMDVKSQKLISQSSACTHLLGLGPAFPSHIPEPWYASVHVCS